MERLGRRSEFTGNRFVSCFERLDLGVNVKSGGWQDRDSWLRIPAVLAATPDSDHFRGMDGAISHPWAAHASSGGMALTKPSPTPIYTVEDEAKVAPENPLFSFRTVFINDNIMLLARD